MSVEFVMYRWTYSSVLEVQVSIIITSGAIDSTCRCNMQIDIKRKISHQNFIFSDDYMHHNISLPGYQFLYGAHALLQSTDIHDILLQLKYYK